LFARYLADKRDVSISIMAVSLSPSTSMSSDQCKPNPSVITVRANW